MTSHWLSAPSTGWLEVSFPQFPAGGIPFRNLLRYGSGRAPENGSLAEPLCGRYLGRMSTKQANQVLGDWWLY